MRPNNTPVAIGSHGSPAPGTEGGSSADLSSSLSHSTEDMTQDMVGNCAHTIRWIDSAVLFGGIIITANRWNLAVENPFSI